MNLATTESNPWEPAFRTSAECSIHPLAAVSSVTALSVASIGIEDDDGTVFAADLDRLAGVGATANSSSR
jgi:hypothetical protein